MLCVLRAKTGFADQVRSQIVAPSEKGNRSIKLLFGIYPG